MEYDEEALAGINIDEPVMFVSHSKLERSGDSLYRSECPVCLKGVFLMRRNEKTLHLEEHDNCILCGQRVFYDDLEDGVLV
jgi:hypothetical protein